MDNQTNLVWIDLEMTGLNPQKDVILELALIITDSSLTILEEGPHFIIHHPEKQLQTMDEWPKDVHTKSGLLNAVCESSTTIQDVEKQVLNKIKEYCAPNTGLLCGNSIWQDRAFLSQYMPTIISYLYYRMIDVTTVKELVLRWYPDDQHAEFEKKDTHRALDDIRESIAELKHYRKYFFV